MRSKFYLLSSFFFFVVGVVASLYVFDYNLYKEYKFVYDIASNSIEKDWLMRAMVKKPRDAFFVNLFKSVFIFLSCIAIMIILLRESLKISREGSDK